MINLRAAIKWHGSCNALARQAYSSTAGAYAEAGSAPESAAATSSTEAQDETAQQQQQQRQGGSGAASASGRPPHIGLEHPDLKAYLSHNTSFKTDEEKLFKVGMIAAMDRKGKTELRKALAAHRLALRDAAAAPTPTRGPASLVDRMASRLAEMEAEVRRVQSTAL